MNKIKAYITDLFFPNRCPVCDDYILYNEHICDKCMQKLEKYKISDYNTENKHEGSNIKELVLCYFYEGIVKDAIYSLKDSSKNFGYHLGTVLGNHIKSDNILKDADYVTAVPMSGDRLRERGYNQAEVIAKEISEITGIKLLKKVLFKRKSAVQHNLTANERKENVKAFYNGDTDLSGKKIILCDDVITTGSTLKKCAELLINMNAAEIYAAVGTTTKLKKE